MPRKKYLRLHHERHFRKKIDLTTRIYKTVWTRYRPRKVETGKVQFGWSAAVVCAAARARFVRRAILLTVCPSVGRCSKYSITARRAAAAADAAAAAAAECRSLQCVTSSVPQLTTQIRSTEHPSSYLSIALSRDSTSCHRRIIVD